MAVYLDNSATTKPCREAVEAVNYMMTENFGNPSSLHTPGIEATKSLISAREAIARALGCEKMRYILQAEQQRQTTLHFSERQLQKGAQETE